MSKIKNGGLDQYGAEPFEQQQLGTAGVEGVKGLSLSSVCLSVCLSVGRHVSIQEQKLAESSNLLHISVTNVIDCAILRSVGQRSRSPGPQSSSTF